jgi:integrase
VITHVVQRAFKKAGIDIKDRKFGPHSLRHSLGFRMLEEHTILPVISEVLGHQSTESTRYYLRIDLQSMKQCMLDVPQVTAGFYQQKGVFFYA